MSQPQTELNNVFFDDQQPELGDSRVELISGLKQPQKTINPKYFYDSRGSELFELITRLPEYYTTRTEISILKQYAEEIAEYCGRGCILIEPGSGSSEKVRLLLNDVQPKAYAPMDISAEFLYESVVKLGEEFSWLPICAVCADFADSWQIPGNIPAGKRVIFYPGSTIGNLEPEQAQTFLQRMRHWTGDDGGVLIGIDLHKSEDLLHAAYNDEQGVTAEFNLNVLSSINNYLNADFDTDNFSHHAFYNQQKQRIEMHLVSDQDHHVEVEGETIGFSAGETIHTENSYKYTLESIADLAEKSGFTVEKSWLDDNQMFSVHYLQAK